MGASVCALCQLEHQHGGTCEAAFTAFCAQFAPVFRRPEPRRQLQAYLRALLLPGTWKTGGQLARLAHDARPDAMQRLLYHAHWDAEQARAILRTWLSSTGGPPTPSWSWRRASGGRKGHTR